MNKQITARFLAAVTIVSLLLSALPVAFFVAWADSVGSISFESGYTLGSVNGQDNWLSTGSYDQGVADVSALALSQLGVKSFRISNAVTSGSFGDQTFVKPLTDSVGEVDATNGTFSPGSKKNTFEMEFDFTSASPAAQQPGLFISTAPDRGDGSRMSYLSFEDVTGGIKVNFVDVQGTTPGTFVTTTIGTYDRRAVNTVKLVMTAVDGPSNDVVKVYINGTLMHTGTSWENYFRFNPESVSEQSPRIVKTVIFRAAGTAVPANDDKGFLFDNLSLKSSDVVAPPKPTTEVDVSANTSAGQNQVGWMFGRDITTATPFVFNSAQASIGLGSLYVGPITNTNFGAVPANNPDKDKFIAEYFPNTLTVADFDGLDYDFKIGSGGDASDANQFYVNVYTNTADNDDFYDCRYDYAVTAASTGVFNTVTIDPTDTPTNVATRVSSELQPCPPTLAAMPAGSHIRAFAINVGDTSASDAGLDAYLDKVVLDTASLITTFDFEPVPKAPICENGKNLLQNASFETPNPDANSQYGGLWEIFSSVLGWNISSDGLEIWDGLFGGASDGEQNAELDGNQNTNISQLVTTIPGATYELKFDFSARPGVADNAITAKANGLTVSATTSNGTSLLLNDWNTVAGTFVATTTNTQIQFVDNGVSNSLGSLIDNTALCLVEEPEPVAQITATKIVCEDESLLPNDGYSTISSTTAAAFLASTPERTAGCSLVPDWKFQWAINQQNTTAEQDNGGELGEPWKTTENTNASGTVKIKIPQNKLGGGKTIAVREVMQSGYVPFSRENTLTSVSAELYCSSDAAGYDNLEWVPNVTAGNNYNCVAWNVELPPPAADVTMCKVDDKGAPLPNWQLSLLGTKVNEISVDPTGVTFTLPAVAQGSYVLKATGAYVYRSPGLLSDAAFSNRLPGDAGYSSLTYLPWQNSTVYAPDNYLGLQVNGTLPWGSVFNPSHVYYSALSQAVTSDVNFKITDDGYSDNSGTILAELYKGYTGVTANNTGCVTFKNVPYGTYTAEELLQDKWQNVSGLGTVVVDKPTVTHTVVNRDVSNVPVATIMAEKIVCADEFDLPNWNSAGTGPAPKITATTAADWVAQSEGACRLVPGWEFEWASENIADPSDTATGTAGVGWNTFGPTNGSGLATVALDADDIDGDSFLWVREVLKDGYIPFTHQATPNNSNNVTAEMYCHIDGLNYDNWDRVDGIAVDKTYYCVAFNAETPKPAPKCELEVVSSLSTLVVETNDFAVKADDNHPSWTASIPGAIWVWVSKYVANPTTQEVYTFEETFTVDNPSSALLDIAADNTFKVFINDDEVATSTLDGSNENNYGNITQKNNRDVLSYLNLTGENTIRIEVTNLAQPGGNSQSNPAGVLFRLDIVGESDCEITTELDRCEYNTELEADDELCVPPPPQCERGEVLVDNRCVEETPVDCPDGFERIGDNECTEIPPTVTPQPESRSSGGGGGTRTTNRNTQPGAVLGASTMQCGMYLLDYMKEGAVNDGFEVKKLQWFLIGQGYVLPVTGIFDDATDTAVKAFQLKYQLEVLTPWFAAGIVPHNNPTGWVYQLTRWKINNIVCPGSEASPVLLP